MNAHLPLPPPPSVDWAYFLDFDGTLVDIAETPEDVLVPGSLLALLRDLQRASAVAIVTGRSLETLDRLLHPIRIAAAGQHGLERRDADGLQSATANADADLADIRGAFMRFAAGDPRLLVEDKGLSIALHFRRAPEQAAAAEALATRLNNECHGALSMLAGKSVFEFRTGGGNKGDAILAFQATAPFQGRRAIMIGDDVTDEDGFDVVNRLHGISIQAGGRGHTKAHFSLPNVDAVHSWLKEAVS